jgi:hypothetical protein
MDKKVEKDAYDRIIEDMQADLLIEQLQQQEERSLRLTCLKLALEHIDEDYDAVADDVIDIATRFEKYILNK